MRLRLRYVVEDDLYFKDLKITFNIRCFMYGYNHFDYGNLLRDYLLITLLISISKVLDLRSDLLYGILQNLKILK